MLSEKEKENIKELLELMPELDLRNLAVTVTQNMILSLTKEEAVQAIILHSATAESLLMRKKMSKEILFRYLHEKRIPCVSTDDKKTFVNSILEFWESNKKSVQLELQQKTSLPTNVQQHEINELAHAFTNWFYSMFNQQGMALGSEHFWQDCSMCMTVTSGADMEKFEVHNSALDVHKLLYNTKFEHNLYFNPNISNQGVRGKLDAYGLILVLVCGTLHQQEKCVGVFEQMFGLIRDPSACNNWKIKKTQLHLKNSQMISRLPTLEEGNLLLSIESA
ncbi:hypothetical protein L9F63_005079 [Diploptera punctata]|uniref:NTF2 domain-containing protein n=1 Tax=Diploptera punctata TaxID=6984 RepID=A0AAD7ZEJ3_DIPPU|nr:hypothetical protein L9F63_005079 [Diploptera punctata]